MSDEQDMRQMGGLRKKLPITFFTMLMGTIAISGLPPFSGFFSKDEILAHTYEHNKILWVIGVIGAMLTAFYMFRMMFLTFFGSFRGTQEQANHLHESPKSMTIPLIVLAVLSVIGGFIGVPEVLGGSHWLANFLSPVLAASTSKTGVSHLEHSTEYLLMSVSVAGALIAAFIAYNRYVSSQHVPVGDGEQRSTLANLSYNKFYVDEIYSALITRPLDALSSFFFKVVDKTGIDGIVNGFGKGALESSKGLRLLQTGNIGFYIFVMVISIAGIIAYAFYKVY
jgi:NADH-quinone oxidoreductase subunit L